MEQEQNPIEASLKERETVEYRTILIGFVHLLRKKHSESSWRSWTEM